MPGTPAGNRKVAANLKKKWGVDGQGRSIFHTTIGSIGGENSPGGYFRILQETDPERLRAIATLGGKATKHDEKIENTD